VLGALLLSLTVAGGYAVAMHKTLTLSVDGSPRTVSTMKSRVIDVVRENGCWERIQAVGLLTIHQSDWPEAPFDLAVSARRGLGQHQLGQPALGDAICAAIDEGRA
jgi:hypothetical protein